MHLLYVLYLMEYVRASRRLPDRLKGGGPGGGARPGRKIAVFVSPSSSGAKKEQQGSNHKGDT